MEPRYPTLESSRARMRGIRMDSASATMRSLKLSMRVGSGTYGSVFCAPQEPRDEVMKVLKSEERLMADDKVNARVRHEVVTLVNLDSARVKGVAKIIGWTDELQDHPLGSCAIFMARAGSISLRQLGSEIKSSIRKGAMIDRNDILNDVAGQVANTLINMHAEGGITHNDVNARNIVLNLERDEVGNTVKARATLVDFGCATWNRDHGRSPYALANNSLFLCPESLFAHIDKNSGKNLKLTDGMQDGWKTDSYAMAATFAREFGLKVYRLRGVDENFSGPNPDFFEVAKHLLACDVNQRWTPAQLQESAWYQNWKRNTSFFEPLPSSVETAKDLQAAGPAEGVKDNSTVAGSVPGNMDDGREKSSTNNNREMVRETASSTCLASGHLAATTRTRESIPPTAEDRANSGWEKDGSIETKWTPAESHSLTVVAEVGADRVEYPPALGRGTPSNSADMGDYQSSTVYPASLSVSDKIKPTRGEESGGAPPSLGVGVPTLPSSLGRSPQGSFLSVQSSTHYCTGYSAPSVGTEAGALRAGIADSDGGQAASGSSRAGDLDTDREWTTKQTASPGRSLTADDVVLMAMGREALPPSANGDGGGSEGSSEQRGAVMGLYRCDSESETVQAVFEELDSDSSMDCSDVKTYPGKIHSDSDWIWSNTDMGIRAGTSVTETRFHGVVGAAMGLDKSASASETVVAVCAELESDSDMKRSDPDTGKNEGADEAAAVASGGKVDPPPGQGGGEHSSSGGAGGSLYSTKYMPYLSGAAGATMAMEAADDLVEVGQAASRETGGFLDASGSSGGALSAVLMARSAKTTVSEAAANAVNPPSALGGDVLSSPFTMGSYLYSSKFAVPKEVATVKCPAGVNLEAPRLAGTSASAPVTAPTERAGSKGGIVYCTRWHTAVNEKDENAAAVDGTQGTKEATFSSQECHVWGTRKRRATGDDGGEEGSYSNDAPPHKKSATMAKVGSAAFRLGVAPRGQRGRGCGGNAQGRVGACGGKETSGSKMGGKATATASTATCRDKKRKKRDRDEDDGNGDGAGGEEECPVTKRTRPSGPPSNISS